MARAVVMAAAAAMMARAIVGRCVRVRVAVVLAVVAAVMVRVVIVVIVVPDVNAVAAVLVAPFDLRLEVRPLAVLIALYRVVRIAAPVTKVPGIRVRDTGVPV